MEKQKVIEKATQCLDALKTGHGNHRSERFVEFADKIYEEWEDFYATVVMMANKKQEWIPIIEAEPGAAHVLATLRWDEDDYEVTEMDYHAIVAAQNDKDKVISAGAKNIIKHVIAWMPLPEPYKEGEK